jgi:hypothetical protein
VLLARAEPVKWLSRQRNEQPVSTRILGLRE